MQAPQPLSTQHVGYTMRILVTGAAGFIGMHACETLLSKGMDVVGTDNLNDYYDPRLKEARLARLTACPTFRFVRGDLADGDHISTLFKENHFSHVLHLGAQAGVRYSLENPHSYVHANITGQLNILEAVRRSDTVEHMVYASSSSVYGANTKRPYSESDPVNNPVSLYAATKRADELMTETYVHLFDRPATGLRFFTVYGPWGRPDMAPWLFTDAILRGKPIRVFNGGNMGRDFTFIDDIIDGTLRALFSAPADTKGTNANSDSKSRHRLYNIGNNTPERLLDFIKEIERATGKTAEKTFEPMQPGDVQETYADISRISTDLGYKPTTRLSEGIPKFVDWFRRYHGL